MTVEPSTAARNIRINGGAGDLNLSTGEIASFSAGYSGITIGRAATGQHAISIGAVSFSDPVTFQTPVAPGSITINGANVTTLGDVIEFYGSVVLGSGLSALIDTTNSGGSAGNDIIFHNSVNGIAGGSAEGGSGPRPDP